MEKNSGGESKNSQKKITPKNRGGGTNTRGGGANTRGGGVGLLPTPSRAATQSAPVRSGNTHAQGASVNCPQGNFPRPPPPPYQELQHPPPLYNQMQPNYAFQQPPVMMQQAQPFQITLNINPGFQQYPQGMLPPQFGYSQYQSNPPSLMSLPTPLMSLKPNLETTSHQPAAVRGKASPRPHIKVSNNSDSARTAYHRMESSAKDDTSSVCSDASNTSRRGQSGRGRQQQRGRGNISRGGSNTSFATNEQVSSSHCEQGNQGNQWRRGQGDAGCRGVRGQWRGKKQQHNMGRGATVPHVEPSNRRDMGNTENRGMPVPSPQFQRGRGTRRTGTRMRGNGRVMVSGSGSMNCGQTVFPNDVGAHQIHHGRGNRGNRGCWTRSGRATGRVLRGGYRQFHQEKVATEIDGVLSSIDGKSVSDVVSDVGEWVDDDMLSIVDSVANISEGTKIVPQYEIGGTVGYDQLLASTETLPRRAWGGCARNRRARVRYRAKWASRVASWVQKIVLHEEHDIKPDVDVQDSVIVTDQLSVPDENEWVDEDDSESESGDVLVNVTNLSKKTRVPTARGHRTAKHGRTKGVLASSKSLSVQYAEPQVVQQMPAEAQQIEIQEQLQIPDQGQQNLTKENKKKKQQTKQVPLSQCKPEGLNTDRQLQPQEVQPPQQLPLEDRQLQHLPQGNQPPQEVLPQISMKKQKQKQKKQQLVQVDELMQPQEVQPPQQLPLEVQQPQHLPQGNQPPQEVQPQISMKKQKQKQKKQQLVQVDEPTQPHQSVPSNKKEKDGEHYLPSPKSEQKQSGVQNLPKTVEIQREPAGQFQDENDDASSVVSATSDTGGKNKKRTRTHKKATLSDRATNDALLSATDESCLSTNNINEADVKYDIGKSREADAETTEERPGEKIDENTALGFVLNTYGAQCKVDQLYALFGDEKPLDVVNYLAPFRKFKVLRKSSDLSQSVVFVIMKGLRLCANIPRCQKEHCDHLHLCPAFVTGTCLEERCRFSHSFCDEHNLPLLQKCGIDRVCTKDAVLLELVRTCNPVVCQAHNEVGSSCCADPQLCLKLHVCSKFLSERCLIPDSSCKFGHELYSERNIMRLSILELYHLRAVNEKLLRRMILTADSRSPRNFTRQTGDRAASSGEPQQPVHKGKTEPALKRSQPQVERFEATAAAAKESEKKTDPLLSTAEINAAEFRSLTTLQSLNMGVTSPSESLCEMFEEHKCVENVPCSKRHGSETLSYCWRVQLGEELISFDREYEIEQAYCDPDCTLYHASVKSIPTEIDFNKMKCRLGEVQRLTTPSYVLCRNKTDATLWRWYWKEGSRDEGLWMQYEDDKPPFQDVLESKYLNDPRRLCSFQNENCQQYLIDFTTMTQVNMKTGFRRDICRRPVFVRPGEARPPVQFNFDSSKLPVGEEWVPMNTELDSWTDLIPVRSDHRGTRHQYSRVSAEFHLTMPKVEYEIKHVYYIQNLDLWKKYQEKKEKIKKVPGQVNKLEVSLFHGTMDETTVRCICHQNFDPRMHGVHGVKYGRGAYFAKTSRYSNSYTRPVGSTGNRYMFFARVLVGKSVLGVEDYKRPPPLDNSQPHRGLYDTCVDDVANPSIFVVFDNVQCYPEFLIEYKDLRPPFVSGAVHVPSSLSAPTGSQQFSAPPAPAPSVSQAGVYPSSGPAVPPGSTQPAPAQPKPPGTSSKQQGCLMM